MLAPYRYRIQNLIYSAIKNGHQVIDYIIPQDIESDVYVSLNLSNYKKKSSKTVSVLEVCEKLPSYSNVGIQNADVVNASSPLLAEHIKEKYPSLSVINIDDHFEMPDRGWL